jgi:Histidine kinase-, DNA gyrase B-, and HSP90-like ATPase
MSVLKQRFRRRRNVPAPVVDERPTISADEVRVDLLATVGLYNLNLLHRLVRLLDAAERDERDAAQLAFLFELDYLIARVRRGAEELLLLAGQQVPLGQSTPEPMAWPDIARAAACESVDFRRVHVGEMPSGAVVSGAADDLVHLLAELVDNALGRSGGDAPVLISGRSASSGVAVTVEDEGIGVPLEQLTALNLRLASPPMFDDQAAAQLSLHVIACLAHRLGAFVQLQPRPGGGTVVLVVVSPALVVADSGSGLSGAVSRDVANGPAAVGGVGGDRWAHPPAPAHAAGISDRGLPQRAPTPGPWSPAPPAARPPDPERVRRDLDAFDEGAELARQQLGGASPMQNPPIREAL